MEGNLEYSLRLNRFIKYSIWGLPAITVVLFILFFTDINYTDAMPMLLMSLMMFALWNILKNSERPIRIDVYENYAILYDVYGIKTKIIFKGIQSIESLQPRILVLRLKSEKTYHVNGLSNFARFVEDVKNKNKDVLIKGL
jgi:hypothetical protein